MIVTKLIGGLGNQMFQYAAGRRTAIVNHTELKLDISGYDYQVGITPRKYMLDIYNIQASVATKQEIKLFNNHSKHRIQRNLHRVMVFLLRRHYIRQKTSGFARGFLTIPDNSYLDGYWGSDKYFKDIEAVIRQDFTFKSSPDLENKKLIAKIKNSKSISVHIRRGDYVLDKKTNQFHSVCSLKYYQQAVKLITQKVSQPYFFIFSDDPQWAEKHLNFQQPMQVVKHNYKKNHHEDMRLMAHCQHHIIANSSFSWWGAWLNSHPDKIVIAPKKWFRDPSINTKDLLPQSWIKI